jgi:hypothetical protein
MKVQNAAHIGAAGVGAPKLPKTLITEYSKDHDHAGYVSALAPSVINRCGWPLTAIVALVHVGLWVSAIVIANRTIDAVGDMKATFNVTMLNESTVDPAKFEEVFSALDNTVDFSETFTVVLVWFQASTLGSIFLFEVVVWVVYYGCLDRGRSKFCDCLDMPYNVLVLICSVAQCSIACVVYTVMMLNMDAKHDLFAAGLSISIVLFFMTSFFYRYNSVWLNSENTFWKSTRVDMHGEQIKLNGAAP